MRQQPEQPAELGPMVSVLSHAARNKLAAAALALDLSAHHMEPASRAQTHLQQGRARLHDLNALFDELLVYTQPCAVEAPQSVDLRGELARLEPLDPSDTSAFAPMTLVGRAPPVWVGRSALRDVLYRLLGNATEALQIEASAAPIAVRLHRAGASAHLHIAQPCQMPPDPALLQGAPFTTNKAGHLGLGLFVSARHLARHGGTLSVAYEAQAGRVVASLMLPIAASSCGARPQLGAKQLTKSPPGSTRALSAAAQCRPG
ncbi:MAG: hypothetical protein EOO40_05610 [Deltaproteobacteria bacterium]|nr:MAG: hypothetical protein EOO40_05610 [Deltaproteobacteria bacterium]